MSDESPRPLSVDAELAAARTNTRRLADTERQLRTVTEERDAALARCNDLSAAIAGAWVALTEPIEDGSALAHIEVARDNLDLGGPPSRGEPTRAETDAKNWHETRRLFASRGVVICTPRDLLALCDALADGKDPSR